MVIGTMTVFPIDALSMRWNHINGGFWVRKTIEKETIVILKGYFDRTRDDLEEQASPAIQRVANALGVGIATVKRVMADNNRGVTFADQANAHKGRPQRVLSDSLQAVTRDYVRKASREGKQITLEMLCQHLKATKPKQEFSIRTLGRALDRWGFTFW